MEFPTKTKSRINEESQINSELEEIYPHNILFYHIPPQDEISFKEFTEISVERLKVFRILEHAGAKNVRIYSKDWKELVVNELNTEGLRCYTTLLNKGVTKKRSDLEARRRDYISHFILRLIYCGTQDLSRWFISREMELFKLKLLDSSPSDIKQFLKSNNLDYTPISEDEKNEVKSGLIESTVGQNATKIEMLDIYKVPFMDVLDLIKSRRCFIKSGFAYVNPTDFISVLATKHLEIIERGLLVATTIVPHLEDDERFMNLSKNLHTSYTGKDFSVSKTANMPIENLDQLSKKSYPLCMRNIHDSLRSKHHLKHFGRLQYGLFLKGIGVTLEDSLKFWHDEFTKIMDPEKFSKSYSYGIRYNYGKEGRMVNYAPYSCLKIINENVGPQDVHGCPYKTSDPASLKTKILSYGIGIGHAQEIISYASKGHIQLACGRYFEVCHDVTNEQGINHPNQYFEMSQVIMEKRGGGTKEQNQKLKTNNIKLEESLDCSSDATLMEM